MAHTKAIYDSPDKHGESYGFGTDVKQSGDLHGIDPWLKEISPPKVSF